jgi:NADPH2:quinone reductase
MGVTAKTMKALLLRQHGGLESLELVGNYPVPQAIEGHVVIRVRASSFNFHDLFTVKGMPGIKVPLPVIIGLDMAGEIAEVGTGVTGWKPGDRVLVNPVNKKKGLMGEMLDGGMAEYCLVAADQLVAMPDGVDFAQAASLPVAYGTAHRMLITHNTVKKGDKVLVLGASGGVGTGCVMLAKLLGAEVIACASSEEKLEFAKAHGAELTLNYAKEDLKEGLRRLTDGKGVDVIFDPVGGTYAEASLRSIAWQGRFLVIGFAAGDIPKMPLNLALLKSCDIRGVFWGQWARLNPAKNHANLEKLVKWTAEGKLSSHVDRTFPLAQTADALKVLAGRKAMGKVILHP